MCIRDRYNADDPWAERLLQNAACRRYSYAVHAGADLRAEDIVLAADHIAFDAVEMCIIDRCFW